MNQSEKLIIEATLENLAEHYHKANRSSRQLSDDMAKAFVTHCADRKDWIGFYRHYIKCRDYSR